VIGASLFRGPRQAQLGLATGALAACAMIIGWHAGKIPVPRATPAPPTAWELPRPAASDTAGDLAVLRSRKPWGGRTAFVDSEIAPAPQSQNAEPWRLAGIIERDHKALALILIGSGPTARLEYRAIGDRLPDGSVFVQIDADSATAQEGQPSAVVQHVYRLFENKR
jgi:hypothetical protein